MIHFINNNNKITKVCWGGGVNIDEKRVKGKFLKITVIDPYLDLNSSKLEGKFLTLVGYLILLKMTVGAFLAVQWLRLPT